LQKVHWRVFLWTTCMEQSSSRSAPIPDIYYFQNTPEVSSVQLILSFSLTVLLTVSMTIFVQPCAAYKTRFKRLIKTQTFSLAYNVY